MMRIVGRSQSPSFPSLETLLPMEKSWALEVEREEETLCLQAKNEHRHRDTEKVKQTERSWEACKRLNSGGKQASYRSREADDECYRKRASRSFESKPYSDEQHHNLSRPWEETKRARQFTSSSRCYPLTAHIRSSEISALAEERESRLQTQRGPHEARKTVRPELNSNSFFYRQHFPRSKDGFSRESQGVKPLRNTVKQGLGCFPRSGHKREMASFNEGSRKQKDHGDDVAHFQGHQELDECKHEFQPLSDKHRYHGYDYYSVKTELSEQSGRDRDAKKSEHQGFCRDITNQKNAKHCGGFIGSELEQHNRATHKVQRLEDKPHISNGGSVVSGAVEITENVLKEGISIFESSCVEEAEEKHDDSIVTKEQYEMLACLLFDDMQEIDEDFDIACEGEGPCCEYSGSLFDDELEGSMDIDDVRNDKEDAPAKPSAACSTKHADCNSRKASVVNSSASQQSKTSRNGYTSSGLKKSSPVLVDVTNKFEIQASAGVKGEAQEDDAHRLSQRQRQIDFGKNTLGYERYTELVPRIKRKAKDPRTPNPKQVCSKRSWDGQIRKWRRLLHVYDPPTEDGEEIAEDFSILRPQQSDLQNCPDAKQDASQTQRCAEADESKGNVAGGDGKNVGDANFTIYDDWMES